MIAAQELELLTQAGDCGAAAFEGIKARVHGRQKEQPDATVTDNRSLIAVSRS